MKLEFVFLTNAKRLKLTERATRDTAIGDTAKLKIRDNWRYEQGGHTSTGVKVRGGQGTHRNVSKENKQLIWQTLEIRAEKTCKQGIKGVGRSDD